MMQATLSVMDIQEGYYPVQVQISPFLPAMAKGVIHFVSFINDRSYTLFHLLRFCARVDEQKHAFKEFLASKNTFHLRIPPGKPQKNGIVERAVQNVKVEALRPFKNTTLADVQKRLYRWRNWYNFHRKHMGIGNRRPAEVFHPYHARYDRYFLTDLLAKDFIESTM